MTSRHEGFVTLSSLKGLRSTPTSCVKRDNAGSCCRNIDRRAFARMGLLSVTAAVVGPPCVRAEPGHEYEGIFSQMSQELFAEGMENGMVEYEAKIASRKKKLFLRIKESDTVVDIGIGTGPNLMYMPKGVRVFGIEPNRYMWPYASQKAGLHGVKLTLLDGIAENIPLEDSSVDIVITTLTLCSVKDPMTAIQEILRVLKPGGQHLFIEHVIASRGRPILRGTQTVLNPLQVALADGCHLNRDTGRFLQKATNPGYSEIEYEEFDALFGTLEDWISPIRPHICGFARKEDL